MKKQSSNLTTSHVAIFWDWQNVKATDEQIRCLMMFAYDKGHVVLKKAYADWGKENQKLADLLFYSFDCINVPSSKDEKNRADDKLIEDCKRQVLKKINISTIIIISGDSDFTGLVNELKANGKKVIVIADYDEKTSPQLKESASEFYWLSQIEERFSNLPLVV